MHSLGSQTKDRGKGFAVIPRPRLPGLTGQMLRQPAARLFRDIFPEHRLTKREWRLVEEVLARKLESDGF